MVFDTMLQPGRFYFNPQLEFSYYCHSVEKGVATMLLVESYQHGMLIQAALKLSTDYQGQYVEITEPREIERLKRVGAKILGEHGAI